MTMDKDTPTSSGTDATAAIEKALSALDDALFPAASDRSTCGGSGQAAEAVQTARVDDDQLISVESAADAHQWFAPSAYRQRLSTFRTETYFAKPLEVSPLECARFGWVNSSSDILACANPSCRAAVCIDINPALSTESAQKLALRYRQMLATAHATTCPFRSDAERWLLDEESKKQSNGFVVPPYLIPMSDEFVLLEDLGAGVGGLVARKMTRTASLQISEYLENANMGVSNLDLSLPQEVVNLVEKENIDFSVNGGTVNRLGTLIFSILAGELQEGDGSNSRVARVLSDEDDFPKLTTNVPLLAAFGWRLPKVAERSSADDSALIECPLCLARVVVSSDTNGVPPTKRQRTGETSLRRQTMDLLKSHRRYCPYVCASSNVGSNSIEAVPGWKAILAMIIKQYRDKENGSSAEEKGSTGEKAFHSVRNLLRSALATHKVPDAK